MNDAVKFGLKSFFAGFLGCLGAIVMGLLAAAVFLFAFKSQIEGLQADVNQSLQSIPEALSQGPPGMGEGAPTSGDESSGKQEPSQPQQSGEMANLFVYLTEGENPDGEKINTFPREQAKNVAIWVQSPADRPVKFRIELIIPDGTRYPFGEDYQTDPSGNPVMCGKLDAPEPPTGTYRLEAYPEGSDTPTGAMHFTITD